jgi:hypothetical protein
MFDVALDLRKTSSTFGRYECFYLTKDNNRAIYMPGDFARGCLALEDNTVFCEHFAGEYVLEKSVSKMQGYYKSAAGFKPGANFKVQESNTLGLDITKSLTLLDWALEMSSDKILYDLVDCFKCQMGCEPEWDICQKQVREFFAI